MIRASCLPLSGLYGIGCDRLKTAVRSIAEQRSHDEMLPAAGSTRPSSISDLRPRRCAPFTCIVLAKTNISVNPFPCERPQLSLVAGCPPTRGYSIRGAGRPLGWTTVPSAMATSYRQSAGSTYVAAFQTLYVTSSELPAARTRMSSVLACSRVSNNGVCTR